MPRKGEKITGFRVYDRNTGKEVKPTREQVREQDKRDAEARQEQQNKVMRGIERAVNFYPRGK